MKGLVDILSFAVYLLISLTFPPPFCLSLSCPWQPYSVSPPPLLCTAIHHQCHSVFPFHMAQHLFGSAALALLKRIQTNGAMRNLEAVSPLYVWCQFTNQPLNTVRALCLYEPAKSEKPCSTSNIRYSEVSWFCVIFFFSSSFLHVSQA